MGIKADLETSEAIREHLEEVTLPELEATLEATLKTVAWLKEKIKEKRSVEFIENLNLSNEK